MLKPESEQPDSPIKIQLLAVQNVESVYILVSVWFVVIKVTKSLCTFVLSQILYMHQTLWQSSVLFSNTHKNMVGLTHFESYCCNLAGLSFLSIDSGAMRCSPLTYPCSSRLTAYLFSNS